MSEFNERRKHVSVKGIFMDHDERVLVVRSTGKVPAYWTLPGGVCEEKESPLVGFSREVREEIGLDRQAERFLAANYSDFKEVDGVSLLFFGGIISEEEKTQIRLQPEELEAFEFLPAEEAIVRCAERGPYLEAGLKVLQGGLPAYLENSHRKL